MRPNRNQHLVEAQSNNLLSEADGATMPRQSHSIQVPTESERTRQSVRHYPTKPEVKQRAYDLADRARYETESKQEPPYSSVLADRSGPQASNNPPLPGGMPRSFDLSDPFPLGSTQNEISSARYLPGDATDEKVRQWVKRRHAAAYE
jgi:hypothetical protein